MDQFPTAQSIEELKKEAVKILTGEIPLTTVLDIAYQERKKYFSNKVRIHILENVKNGNCSENCGYCAQRKGGDSGITEFSMKDEDEILKNAQAAKQNGAFRFCMAASGTGPGEKFTEKLAGIIEKITNDIGIKVCLSAGFIDHDKAQILKNAGLDRYNHNLNTSKENYINICDTHDYNDRLATLNVISDAGIGICSGVIAGMGETDEELVNVALELKAVGANSIPVNFFIPIKGHSIRHSELTPEKCVRILCMFRIVNPAAEVRIAAGREGHLRGLQSMALFAANSLFAEGYLNVKGSDLNETIGMICDAGFIPETAEGVNFSEKYAKENLYRDENISSLYKYKSTKE